jgi:lysophospholipase L1-like esterase
LLLWEQSDRPKAIYGSIDGDELEDIHQEDNLDQMNSLNKLFKNLMALILGIMVAFLIAEGVLRIYNPFDFRVKGDSIVLPANKKYVFKKKLSKIQHSKFDKIIVHTKNSLGFRGEEPPANFSNYLKIITVGGSTTECTFLSDGRTWTDVLAKKLKSKFKYFWVNNAGFDGHSTFGHIVLMKDYIIKLKPDIVLYLIGANDQGIKELNDQDLEIMRNKFEFSSTRAFLISMATHSEVFSLGLNLYRYWKAVEIGVEHAEFDFNIYRKVDLDRYSTDDYIKAKRQVVETARIYAKGFRKRLKKLIDISEKNNIVPILITQPAFYGDFIDDVTGVDFRFTEISWERLEVFNDVTREVGKENNLLIIDLAREMPKSSKYYYDWFHYSNEGAEKVAEIIYNRLYPYLAKKYSNYLK